MSLPPRPRAATAASATLRVAVAAVVLAGVVLLAASAVASRPEAPAGAGPGLSGAPSGATSRAAASSGPSIGGAPSSSADVTGAPASGAPVQGGASAGATTTAGVPVVPVVDFRSTETSVSPADVSATLAGTSHRYRDLELVAADADQILTALGAGPPSDPARLIRAATPARLVRDLALHRDRLGFLRATDVSPAVHALGWTDRSLFGVDRVRTLADWPLVVALPAAAGSDSFVPAGTWTMVAGGDILLDRGVARQVTLLHKGIDFPFDGGTAAIASRSCCSAFGWTVPHGRRTGNAGAVRHLLTSADLAVANFENPAPDRFSYHTHGTVFSANPALIEGVRNAGIDWVSTANNHIGDAGTRGVVQTIANLSEHGIETSGSGATEAAARAPALLTVDGLRVAFLGYDTIAKYYAAGPSRAGSAQMTPEAVTADVKAARAAGADLVIVYPHWGVEYTKGPTSLQRSLAHAAIDAGADMVVGNHPHWVEGMEVYRGKPIWYALGNFVFDQTWSEPTEEGMLLELTFSGRTLVQVALHPTLILDGAQPNFLDPAGDGKVVLDRFYSASSKLLPW